MGIAKIEHFDGKNFYWGFWNMFTQQPLELFRKYFYNHFKFWKNLEERWPERGVTGVFFCHLVILEEVCVVFSAFLLRVQ